MSLPAGQVADKIYLPVWTSNLARATGQPLMSHPVIRSVYLPPSLLPRGTCARITCKARKIIFCTGRGAVPNYYLPASIQEICLL